MADDDKRQSGKRRGRTKVVEELQIVGQRPVTAEVDPGESFRPKARKPPVRELARTGLFHSLKRGSVPVLPPDEATPPEDAQRVPREVADPDHLRFVELCPTPLFQLDAEARIEWANEPFAEFARKPVSELAGERIDSTRLGIIYPTIYEDLLACMAEPQPPTLKQSLRYQLQDGREQARGCWIVPQPDGQGGISRFFGYLLPIED